MVETQVDESSQVDGGHSESKLGLVGFDSSVADPPMVFTYEPGYGSFHHGPVLSVIIGELSCRPCSAGLDQFRVVGRDVEHPTVLGSSASGTERTSPAAFPERGRPFGSDDDHMSLGAGDGARPMVNYEVVSGEPSIDGRSA